MGRLVWLAAVTAAVTLGAPLGSAGAQQLGVDSARAAALARLRPGGMIRIHVQDGGRLEGRVARPTDSVVYVGDAAAPTVVRAVAIDSLWERGTAAKTGFFVGALPGLVGGVLLGVVANGAACEGACPEAIPLLGIGGAAAGGLLGAVIGAAMPKWHRRVP